MTSSQPARLIRVAEGLWTAPAPLRFWGLDLNTRMTVCRLADNGLALISPVAISDELRAEVDALGPVRVVISPNLLHHLYVAEWLEAYPSARGYVPPGLAAKRAELKHLEELGDRFDAALGADLLRVPIAGMPRLNESLFFHRSSATLVAADFCFHMPLTTEQNGLTRIFTACMRIRDTARCEPYFLAMVNDKKTFRASLEPLRVLTPSHLSMCHHSVLSAGATEALQQVLDQVGVR